MRGHLANRLTSALFREAVYLFSEGVADVEDLDAIFSNGLIYVWLYLGLT